ncbi:MAG: hypothetical protein ACR2QA_05550 [Solirubrobacteraceae bacterium]
MPATPKDLDDVRSCNVARAEDVQRDQRIARRRLAGKERSEERE